MQKSGVYILGGGLRKDEDGRWRSVNFCEKGITGRVEGGGLRVIAAFHLYKENPDILLISSGGVGKYKNISGVVPIGKIIKDELMELGVPLRSILVESKSNNTFEQLKTLKEIIKKYSLKNVIIISNKYHLPRIEAMIKNVAELADINKFYKNLSIRLQSAEDIVLRFDQNKWLSIIKTAYGSDDMKARIKSEENGILQIKMGHINFSDYAKYNN